MAEKIAAYIRVSSDKQDTLRQRESIESWAGRNKNFISYWFEDSIGKNPRDQPYKREGFQKLIAAVKAGIVDVIVVDAQDRFGTRDAYQWGHFINLLREHGCRLLDSSGKDLSADDDGAILAGTLGAMTSAREQKEKARRSLSGKLPKARQGEYQGGYPPYGFDVVCFGPDGVEKWRTLYVGHYKRFKVYPDGRREQFDGKDNSPTKDSHDVLRYRPSIEKSRVENAALIFKWYAQESISPGQIADRLNELGVDPIFSDAWYKVTIAQLLRNPIYIGLPTWNKRAGSRFYEFVDGLVREVPKTNGTVRLGRRRSQSDQIQPTKPEFDPIVDSTTWSTVQSKRAESSAQHTRPKRSAQIAELWLKPFLYCAHCGCPMRASRGMCRGKLFPSYFCGTYGTYGKKNKTECRCHRVKHGLLETIVRDYVTKYHPKVSTMLTGLEHGGVQIPASVEDAWLEALRDEKIIECDMVDDVIRELGDSYHLQHDSLEGAYAVAYSKLKPIVAERIDEMERELEKMMGAYVDLPQKLRLIANAKMEELSDKIQQLRLQIVDLQLPLERVRAELRAREVAVERAKKLLGVDGQHRQWTDAVDAVIERINCRFRHSPGRGTSGGKSFLDEVEIVPVSAEKLCITVGISPGPG